MKDQNLSRLGMAAVVCLTIVLLTHLTQSLQGASIVPKRQYPKGKLPPLIRQGIIPTAPTIPHEEPKKAKKGATLTSRTSKFEKMEREKESKREKKQVATPTTRNLIMIFDDGNDKGAMLDYLATGLLQPCAFIIINQQLWELFKATPAQSIFIKDFAQDPEETALRKALDDQSCAEVFFSPHEWDVYTADGIDASHEDRFYVFVPRQYISSGLGNPRQDREIGLNLSSLTNVKDPLKTAATKTASENNHRQGLVTANALGKMLCQTSTHPWNVYCVGHGCKGDRSIGEIIGLSLPAFENLTQLFDTKVRTNFFFYDTCFAGGQHLTIPFTIEKAPVRLSYPIAAGSISDAPTSSHVALLGSWTARPNLPCKIPIETLRKAVGKTISLFTGTNFPVFFKGLEAFAIGTSSNTDLIHTLNAVGNFLTPDLQKENILSNIPNIRMPGTEYFQLMRLQKDLPITNLTHAKIMQQNIDAQQRNQPWEFDVTGNNIVLLQTSDIAIPLIINIQTKLVPLMPTIPFLQHTDQTPPALEHQHLVAFTAPLIAHMGFFETLSSLWYLPKQIELTDTILLIDTLICGNDLEDSQQKLVSKATVLQLKRVMIYINASNPFYQNAKNTALFTYNEKAFLIDMDQLSGQLLSITPAVTRKYQAFYERYKTYCIDEGLTPLREANEKSLGAFTITKETQALKFMKKELQHWRGIRLQRIKKQLEEIQADLESAQKAFLSNDGSKWAKALAYFQAFLSKNISVAFPIIAQTAATALLSTNKSIRENALVLFEALSEKQYGIALAINTALKGVESTDEDTRKSARTLFGILFTQRQNLEQAITIALTSLQSPNENIRKKALALSNILISNNQGIPEAISAVNHMIISPTPYIRHSALDLLKALFKEDKDNMSARTIIKKLAEIDNPRGNHQLLKDLKNVLMWRSIKALTQQNDRPASENLEKASLASASSIPTVQRIIFSPRQPIAPPSSALSSPKASTPRQPSAPSSSSVTSPKAQPQQDEYWICPACDTENKAYEAACIECKAPKPATS